MTISAPLIRGCFGLSFGLFWSRLRFILKLRLRHVMSQKTKQRPETKVAKGPATQWGRVYALLILSKKFQARISKKSKVLSLMCKKACQKLKWCLKYESQDINSHLGPPKTSKIAGFIPKWPQPLTSGPFWRDSNKYQLYKKLLSQSKKSGCKGLGTLWKKIDYFIAPGGFWGRIIQWNQMF